MFNIFDYLSNDERCSNIANCIHITHENFMPYTISSTCGTGKDPYDILNSKNEYVFSTELYNYSITFDIRYRYRVEVKNYMIESRINNQGCFWRYPRKFRLLGSNNKRDWKELSNHEGDELSTRGKLISFPVTKNQGIYSSFKLIVDDTVSGASNTWSSISRFGIDGIFVKTAKTCLCLRRRSFNFSLFLLVMLFTS